MDMEEISKLKTNYAELNRFLELLANKDQLHANKEVSFDQLKQQLQAVTALLDQYKNENLRLRNALFSRKKERFVADQSGAQPLFDEVEAEVAAEEPTTDSSASDAPKSKKKKRGKRAPLPKHLPRERQENDLLPEQKICAIHQTALVKIGEEIVEKLVVIPATVKILEIATGKYKCPDCESCTIVPAPRDPDPIPKSFASPELLAYIAVAKFADALPLYRQEQIFARYEIDLSRTTMARWMIRCAELALPLYNLMHEELLETAVIHADETEVQVLKEENRSPESKSYMWCLSRSGIAPLILFMYFTTRSADAAKKLLLDYAGIVVADAYKVYRSLSQKLGFTIAGCMAHCRRKFFDAEKIAKKQASKDEVIIATSVLKIIRQLYLIERDIIDKPPDDKKRQRQERSVPIMATLKAYLDQQFSLVLPKSPTGKAIAYALNNWDELNRFLDDGRIPIDNNFMEANIRPFAIGRNNWVFSVTPAGAQSSAILYSLVQSAKANDLEPYSYLTTIFKELPKAVVLADFEKLLPHRVSEHFPVKHLSTAR